MRIDQPVREEDRESEASSDTPDDSSQIFKPPTPMHKVSSTITRNDKSFKAAIASVDDEDEHQRVDATLAYHRSQFEKDLQNHQRLNRVKAPVAPQ